MAGLFGNYEDDEPQGLLGGLQQGFMNPMTLGGLALLSGEGFQGAAQGMRMGQSFQEQRRADQQRRQYQGLLQDPAVTAALPPEMLRVAQMAGPSQGPEFLAKYLDPARETDLQLKRAQIAKTQREAAGGEDPANWREWQQFNRLSPEDQQRYLTMKRAEKYLDAGDRFVQPNPVAPGQMVREVPKNVAEEARLKAVGQETGDRQMAQPKAFSAMTSADAKSDVVLKTIGEARQMVGPYTAGLGGSLLRNLPGTAARDLSAKLDTLKANAGFAELQAMRDNSPTGGALGQVAVQELAMLQATITSLEQAQTPQQLSQALDGYERFIRESKVRRKQAYDATYGTVAQPGQQGSSPPASGNWSIKRVD